MKDQEQQASSKPEGGFQSWIPHFVSFIVEFVVATLVGLGLWFAFASDKTIEKPSTTVSIALFTIGAVVSTLTHVGLWFWNGPHGKRGHIYLLTQVCLPLAFKAGIAFALQWTIDAWMAQLEAEDAEMSEFTFEDESWVDPNKAYWHDFFRKHFLLHFLANGLFLVVVECFCGWSE